MAWIVAQTTEMQGRVAPSVFHPHHGICRKKVVWAATKGLCFHSPMLLKYQVVESRLFVAVGGKAFDKREVRSGSYMLCRSFCQKRVSAGVFIRCTRFHEVVPLSLTLPKMPVFVSFAANSA